jgi:OPA family glycerol-3-phosphate transporter-like MFS transporter 1/2
MATIGNCSTRINLKYFVALGMLLASLFYMSFSFLVAFSHHFSYPFLVVAMCFNAYFQSTGWPGIVGIIGNWFGKGKRGLLMGIWALNANAGNILALVTCNILDQSYHLYWTANFFTTGFFSLSIALLCLLILK